MSCFVFSAAAAAQFFSPFAKICRRLAMCLTVVVFLAATAHAITINIEYSTDFGGDESPQWDANGAILIAHFQAAKQIWEALLPGSGDITFDFQWDNDIDDGGPGITLGLTTENAFDTYIELNPDASWFADPTPGDNAEFDFTNRQTLYGELSLANQSYFPGTAPPAALEVGYRGAGLTAYPSGSPTASASGAAGMNANTGYDLLSTIVHEIGHVLGISGVEPGEYNIYPHHVGGLNNVLVQEDNDSGHLAGDGDVPFLMCNNCGTIGERRLPTATDILVIAEDQGITNVHLDRVGSISSGLWNDASLWIGADVPDINQDAYIAHNGTTTLNADHQARSLRVFSGNSVVVDNHQLSLKGALTFQGGTISVAAGGTVAADSISDSTAISATPPGTLVTTPGSLVRFNSYSSAVSSSANFNGSVAIGYDKLLTPTLPSPVFTPTSIISWDIAEQLAVGDNSATAKLVMSVGVDFTSATGVIGSNYAGGGLGHVDLTDNGSTWTTGAFDARKGTLNVLNKGELTTGATNVGSNPSGGLFVATVDDALWNVNGNIVVGPTATTGATGGTLTLKNLGRLIVTGNLNVRGTSSLVSELIVESAGRLNVAGDVIVSPYGRVTYGQNTTADNETFTNLGSGDVNMLGGVTQFTGNASAGNGNFTNNGGTAIFGYGGRTTFGGTSTAAFADIVNVGPSGLYAYHGRTLFLDSASAGDATITNQPSSGGSTTTDFYGTSTAGNATIINQSGAYPTVAGITTFRDASSAGSGSFINEYGGQFIFEDSSTAGQGTFTNGAFGGLVIFKKNSSAGQANIVVRASGDSRLIFYDNSSAGAAHIDVGPLTLGPTNESSLAQFFGNSTAANSTITVRGDGGSVSFAGSTAGNASIVALGSTRPGSIPGTAPGQVLFGSLSTAGNATITAEASTVAGAPGGLIQIHQAGHAGSATLIANGGATAVNGGLIRFGSAGTGGSARLIVNAGALADFSLNAFHGGTAVGSIEGAGNFSLGASLLTVGNLNTSTTVSGNITDSGGYHAGTGGMLTKVGTGTLTLSGANTYSGLTTVDEGTLAINGSIAAGALVKEGGILKGTGSMGNVTVESGGVFTPGLSPGTITVGGLNLMSGSTLEYELGAARDHIVLTNNGNVTLGGLLDLSILPGFNPLPGQTFKLFEGAIGSITGVFSSVIAPIFNGHTLSLLYGANQVTLQVIDAILPPGDYNGNGIVDAADYVVWRDGLGTTFTQTDYEVWRAHFGQTAGSGSSTSVNATVPEPASLVLLMFAAAGWCLRRGRAA